MKILYVVNKCTYTSIPVEMAELLARDNEVTILALYDKQITIEEIAKFVAPSCRVIGCDLKSNFSKGRRLICNTIRHGNFDIVHTHQTLSGAMSRIIASKNRRTKIVHTVHANHHSFSWKQNLVIGMTLKYCDAIVFNSESTREGLLKWQQRRVKNIKQVVIHNGIDTERIDRSNSDFVDKFIENHGIKETDFVFAQIGRLEKVKNPYAGLCAFEMALSSEQFIGTGVKYIFIGNGSEKDKLIGKVESSELLQSSVIFAGMVQREEVYSMLRRVNAIVVPSLFEGFCNALFEGLYLGIPLAVSDIPVFQELLSEEKSIVRFDPQNIKDMSEALKKIRNQSNTDKDKEGKKSAFQYGTDKCIMKYMTLYNEILVEQV